MPKNPKMFDSSNFCPKVEGRRTFDLDLRHREGRRSKVEACILRLEARLLRPKSPIHFNFCPQVESRRASTFDLRRWEGRRSKGLRPSTFVAAKVEKVEARILPLEARILRLKSSIHLNFCLQVENRRNLDLRPSSDVKRRSKVGRPPLQTKV